MQDLNKFKNEMNLSGQNLYVGHRYVPKIMGDWDNTQIYEPLSIVQYQGNSFTSRQFVPSGIEITNEEYWAVTGNYNAQVEQYRQDVRNLESDIANFNDDIVEITNGQNSNVKMLDSLGVYVVNFGVIPNDATVDNHDAIINALNYAKANNIATIIFPHGEIYTSPISLEGYQYLKFKGQSSYNYADYGTPISHNETSLRFISNAEFGIQTAGVGWSARGISFEDITLNGDFKIDNVVNARYNTTFENFVARGGKGNGIVLEDSTYPVKLVNTHANFNKGHGLYVKTPLTTVYHVTDCEFSRNDGYGIVIEGFAGSAFKNITVQDNKRGGVKINSPEDTDFNSSYWLQTLLFDTLYTEANGQLEETDTNYEGNYALIITGVGSVRPRKVHFINSTLNKHAKGRNIKVDYGEDIYFDLNTYVQVNIDVNKNTDRVTNVHFSKVTNTWQRPTITYYGEGTGLNVIPTIYKPEKIEGFQITGAFIGSRGRTNIYEFYNKDIEVNTPTEMNTFSGSGKSYHCHDAGSILGVHLTAKNRSTINGKFTISIEKRKLNNGTWGVMANDAGTEMVYSWDTSTANDMLQRYLGFNDYKIARDEEIRVMITSQGHVRREDNNFNVTMIVEY